MPIRLAYVCTNITLGKKNITTNRSVQNITILKLTAKQAVELCQKLALENLADLLTILKWNEQHGIRAFRMSSTIYSHIGNHYLPRHYQNTAYMQGDIAFSAAAWREIGDYARAHGHRLTFHSQSYLQLGAMDEGILRRSIAELALHGKMFAMAGITNGVVILHGGGFYAQPGQTREEAKTQTMQRWISRYKQLPKRLRDIVTLENDEKIYGIADLLPLCEQHGIQFCFDVFHNSISADRVEPTAAIMRRCCATWTRDIPKFHLSEHNKQLRFGAHADMVRVIPDCLLKLRNIDIYIEAKNKELAVMYLLKKYFVKQVKNTRVEWALL